MTPRKALKPRDPLQLQLPGFVFTETGCEPIGTPSYEEYEAAMAFAQRAHKASGWWLADLLRYGDSRKDWKERLAQAQHITGLSEKRLKNIRAIGAIAPSRRRDAVEFELHAEVAAMRPEDQNYWLERAETEGWTRSELRMEIAASKRRKVIEGQATLSGQYRIIMADPAWPYRENKAWADGSHARATQHYADMSVDEICRLPVAAHALPKSTLFLWVPAPFVYDCELTPQKVQLPPTPLRVANTWGFTEYVGNFVWDKVLGMPGKVAHVIHEHLFVFTRGGDRPDAPTPQPKSIFTIRRSDTHSEKPNADVRRMIQKLYTVGPYLELFGRERVEGWDVFGNDARLWAEEKAS